MKKIKLKLTWIVLIWNVFIILCIQNWFNIKYLWKTLKELNKILKKNSKYIEDGDYYLIKKRKRRKKL